MNIMPLLTGRFWCLFEGIIQPIFWQVELVAGVAQLVEQLICNQQVGGSIPFASFTERYFATASVIRVDRLDAALFTGRLVFGKFWRGAWTPKGAPYLGTT
jgi:hypothetical protein